MFCKHKFGKIDNGYQYCKKCGRAAPVDCSHNWMILDTYSWETLPGRTNKFIYIQQCSKCGELKKVSTND